MWLFRILEGLDFTFEHNHHMICTYANLSDSLLLLRSYDQKQINTNSSYRPPPQKESHWRKDPSKDSHTHAEICGSTVLPVHLSLYTQCPPLIPSTLAICVFFVFQPGCFLKLWHRSWWEFKVETTELMGVLFHKFSHPQPPFPLPIKETNNELAAKELHIVQFVHSIPASFSCFNTNYLNEYLEQANY